jgi:DNA-directed RNA polymerase specialized sigma24 family protein
MMASYQENRSVFLKEKREQERQRCNVEMTEFFTDEERAEYVHQREISRYVSHCSFALESLGMRLSDEIDEELLKPLTDLERTIVVTRFKERVGFTDIAKRIGLKSEETKKIFERSMRKITKYIREKNLKSN